jgi:hypothetical protein
LCHGREGLYFHGVAKVSQAFDETFFLLVGGPAIEVIATEVPAKASAASPRGHAQGFGCR